jgi:hypothetical protein
MARAAFGRDKDVAPVISTLSDAQRLTNISYYAYPNVIASMEWSGGHFLTFWPRGTDRVEIQVMAIGMPAPDSSTEILRALQCGVQSGVRRRHDQSIVDPGIAEVGRDRGLDTVL